MITRRLRSLATIAAIHFALAPLAGQAADAPVVLKLATLFGDMKRVKIRIEDTSAWMILDTGGGWSIAGKKLAAAIGCQPFGRITGFRQTGERIASPKCGTYAFDLGGVRTRGFLSMFDVGALLPPEWPKVDGLVALPVLNVGPLTIDWSGNAIVLETEASLRARTKGLTSSPMRVERETVGTGLTIFLEVAAKPEPMWFMMDSGNVGGTVLAPHALAQLGLDPSPAGDVAQNRAGTTVDLIVAGQPVRRMRVDVLDIIHDGNLGTDFLNRFVITLDIANQRVWLVPN